MSTADTTTTDDADLRSSTLGGRASRIADVAYRTPVLGPLMALIVACVIFSLVASTFFSVDNLSLILQQSVVVGTLALGQTVIILTAGIDLANGAIMVIGTLVIAKETGGSNASQIGLLVIGTLVCGALGGINGALVSRLKLPPFIVTLGALTVLQAVARLYTTNTIVVPNGALTWLATSYYLYGYFQVTYGVVLVLISVVVLHYALTQTAWGRHVYAVGNSNESAQRTGIAVNRVLMSVYILAGLLYALAAWQALGRSPATSANAFPTANLDAITAVVIGGTSLFGGRGTVLGSYIGALIVLVLQSGLTQAGIDPLYQQVATGILVILAVALDQITRRRAR